MEPGDHPAWDSSIISTRSLSVGLKVESCRNARTLDRLSGVSSIRIIHQLYIICGQALRRRPARLPFIYLLLAYTRMPCKAKLTPA